ncbi:MULTISPECIES: energy transducer TonB [Variovorax]|uniref:energy transducer TonB n=1 Tax=Variovorax TaxID=34072 RepID=UPI0034E8E6FD
MNEAIHAPDRAPVAASAQEPSTDSSPAAAAPALSVTAEADSDSYVPRSQLSTPPIAKTAIVLESPPNEIGAGRLVGVLSLFIDEQGRVQLIEAEEPALPPAFEQAAREAFMGAEFSPGEVGGRAVKSHQRVEVVFDTITTSRRGEVEMPD